MSSSVDGIRTTRMVVSAVVVLLSLWNMVTWLRSGVGPAPVLGAAVGAIFVWKFVNPGSSKVLVIALYAVLAFFGLGSTLGPDRSGVASTQLLWSFLALIALIVALVLDASMGGAAARDRSRSDRKAHAARIEANRRAQLEYAERIEREQNFQERASRPGQMTGYEPSALASVDIDAVRPPIMHGRPGAGLHGAGFDEAAVKRGEEGELNFAKALAKAGLLDRFATFWSVHMPDETVGASSQFSTDIDCVVVTGKSVWLLDMKNYNQGDVTWKSEASLDASGKGESFLIAIDNVTGGLVGGKRKMSLNMQLASQRFTRRFTDNGVRFGIRPAVVLMPRNDGIGLVRNVQWAGDITTAGLPDVLHWLADEPPFDPGHRDASLLLAILKPLLKNESGSAPRPGEVRRAPRSASPVVQVPSPAPAAAVPAAPAAPSGPTTCRECGTQFEPEWSFCYACGATS